MTTYVEVIEKAGGIDSLVELCRTSDPRLQDLVQLYRSKTSFSNFTSMPPGNISEQITFISIKLKGLVAEILPDSVKYQFVSRTLREYSRLQSLTKPLVCKEDLRRLDPVEIRSTTVDTLVDPVSLEPLKVGETMVGLPGQDSKGQTIYTWFSKETVLQMILNDVARNPTTRVFFNPYSVFSLL